MMIDVLLYTRRGCHLCEDAKAVLEGHGLQVREIDIDTDPSLAERFHTWIPVVLIDGQERFRGRVSERLLKRLLKAQR